MDSGNDGAAEGLDGRINQLANSSARRARRYE